MANLSAKRSNWTPTAVADATAFTDNGYFAIQGGSATQRLNIKEVRGTGMATASAAQQLALARDSTVGATSLSGGTLAALDPATAALAAPPVAFSVSTTKPQRSSTLHLLDVSFNAFGGQFCWQCARGEEIGMLGNAASFGEASISHLSSGAPGLMGCHIIFEPL